MQSTSASGRHLFADGDVRDRHRPELRAGAGAEPRLQRAGAAAAGGAGAGRAGAAEVTSILEIVTLTSPDGSHDSLFLSNYATINLVNELARVPGVGNVNVFGVGQYAMRIWLDPQKLQARGLTPQDVIKADPAAEPAGRRRADRHAAGARQRRTSSTP